MPWDVVLVTLDVAGGVQLAALVQALAFFYSPVSPHCFPGSVWTHKQVVSPSSVLQRQKGDCLRSRGHLCAH